MGDPTRGLYVKFRVTRTDGSSEAGGKHDGCNYFVLDNTHDKHAAAALLAYADSCEVEYPLLAADLRDLASQNMFAASPPETAPATCAWVSEDEEGGCYNTSCGKAFSPWDGEPPDYIKFCCYCGKAAVIDGLRAAHGSRPTGRPDRDDWTVSDRDQRLGLTHLDAPRT